VIRIVQPEFRGLLFENYLQLYKSEDMKVIDKLLDQFLKIISQ